MFKRYFHCTLHAECSARRFQLRNKHTCSQIATIYSTLTKSKHYFAPFGDISQFERYFHCTLHAECGARRFQLRNTRSSSKIAIIYSILKKIERYFSSVGGISTFKRYFHCILHAECSANRFQRRNRRSSTQIVTTYSILTNPERYFSSVG